MKKLLFLVMAGSIATAPLAATADSGKAPERFVQHMNKTLELDEKQQQDITDIFAKQHKEMKKLHKDTEKKVNKVLTKEQQKQWKEAKEERAKKWEERKANAAKHHKDGKHKRMHHKGKKAKMDKKEHIKKIQEEK